MDLTLFTIAKLALGLTPMASWRHAEVPRPERPPALYLPPQHGSPRAVLMGSRPRRPPLAPPLEPEEAARQFVTWMQEHEFLGERPWFGCNGLLAFYAWHCDEVRATPVAENNLGFALALLLRRRQSRDWSTGKLRRSMRYMIPELPTEAPAAIPMPNAPMANARPKRLRQPPLRQAA